MSSQSTLSNDEIIEAFGKPVYEDKQYAPEAIPELALLWEQILTKGLPDESLNEIIKKIPHSKELLFF